MRVLGEHDIRYIEMRGVNGRSLVEHSLDEIRVIKKSLDSQGFGISAVGSPIGKIGITDDFAPHLDLFRHTLAAADILESRYIRMFSFYIPKGEEPADYRGEVLHRWQQFVDAAADSGRVLLHENEKGIYGDTAERCFDLLDTLQCPYVRATFDPANFIQCGEETYPEAYERLRPYIEYFHIKDARLGDGQVVPAGYGDGRITEMLQSLAADGWKGFLSLEPHLGSFSGLASLERDGDMLEMPEGGPEKFAVAVNALKDILRSI